MRRHSAVALVSFLALGTATAARASDESLQQRLAHSIIQNEVEKVKALLDQGADPNGSVKATKEDEFAFPPSEDPAPPALVLASRFGAPESQIVRLLLERGAKVDAKDRRGRTPLMRAAELGWGPSVGLLLERRADVNARDANGAPVLTWAMGNRNLPVVATLVEKGAKVNVADSHGQTPLMAAILRAIHDPIRLYGQPTNHEEEKARYVELVDFLIRHGADVNARDQDGLTPLKLAASQSQPEIAALLRESGAGE